jgi:carboxyl-terminal processing protease
VTLPNVSSRVEKRGGRKLGYVRLLSFSSGAHAALARAVRKVEREGAEGIVLDLRGNPGGLLDEAVLSASVFLPEGEVVVSTRSRSEGESVHRTSGGNLPARPLTVLIDRGTASAAEILTAALAENGDATVVGARSYGKGVFQEERDLANGGALKLTVGEYFTPDGTNLAESKGVHPDVRVGDDPATAADEQLQRALGTLAGRAGG